MWPFTKKYNLEESDLLQGMTDWHSHLLPGVDDGVKEIEETLQILEEYERLGVSSVWLTPHIMEDSPNLPSDLRERFAQLKDTYKGQIILRIAAENMLDNVFDDRIDKKDVLPIGYSNDSLLIETSYFTAPYDFDEKIEKVFSAGFFPILAHPERYVYMQKKNYNRLLDRGVKFQLNLYSLFGMYGPEAASKARTFLNNGSYSYVGTDTHRLKQLHFALKTKAVTSKEIDSIKRIIEYS